MFSNRSKLNLAECHPDLQLIFLEVSEYVDCEVIEGHRHEREQRELYRAGSSKLNWPDSLHNLKPSMAADVLPSPIDWNDTSRFYMFVGRVIQVAERLYREGLVTHQLRCGADWDGDGTATDQTFQDLIHFELVRGEIYG